MELLDFMVSRTKGQSAFVKRWKADGTQRRKSEKFLKNFKKGLDKAVQMCYIIIRKGKHTKERKRKDEKT